MSDSFSSTGSSEPSHASVCVLGSYAEALVMTVERIPKPGETLMGHSYRQEYGGKGSDMAVQAARLGADVSYVGVVGNDSFGQRFRDLMETEGVDTSALRVTDEHATGVGLILKDEQARNVIAVDMGANELFDATDIDAAGGVIAQSDVVLAQLEIPLTTALYGMKVARRAGKITVLNPAPAVDLTQVDLSDVDFITPNETEARVCVGLAPDSEVSDADIARRLQERGAKNVVITLGERGSECFLSNGDVMRLPAFCINEVDSNGAGDSFNAAFCVGLAEGHSVDYALRFASATSSLCCTQWETVPSYHDRSAVEDFLASATLQA
jgi:ribokinase